METGTLIFVLAGVALGYYFLKQGKTVSPTELFPHPKDQNDQLLEMEARKQQRCYLNGDCTNYHDIFSQTTTYGPEQLLYLDRGYSED